MKPIVILAAAAMLASCGPEPQPEQPDTLPMPSGPPLAQQAAPQPVQPAPVPTSPWESRVAGGAVELRLLEGGEARMRMACLASPARLSVEVPGFTAIGSEDRFSLGLGNEPVTLVANLSHPNGVAAEGAIPANLEALLRDARQVTALYGTQQIGPVDPPPPQLIETFAEACQERAG
jgi:hypothetical protein